MDEQITTDYGANRELAIEFGVSAPSVTRYLRGQYRNNNPNIDTIRAIRARAKKMISGTNFYVARDDDGSLNCFAYEPRKVEGRWVNVIDNTDRHPYPEIALPESAKPRNTDKYAIVINATRKPNKM